MRFGVGGRARVVLALAGGLAIGGFGAALASIPSSDGTFTGCVGATGKLRVIDADAGATCTTGEQAITGPADGSDLSSARVETSVAASGNSFRNFVSPAILTVPSGVAHPDTYSITAYLLTDARTTSRRCTIKGNVMPAS